MVGVAQSVEHQVVALVVAGSIPVTHPIIFRACLFPVDPSECGGYPGKCRALIVCDGPVGFAGVVELVDTLDLGSSAERRGGSSPFTRTKFLSMKSY